MRGSIPLEPGAAAAAGTRRAGAAWVVPAALLAAAAYFVLFRLGETTTDTPATYDIYAAFYPNMLYALRCIAAGGSGLLWNPYQNCGQPFLPTHQTALLYPINLLFLLLAPDHALRAVIFVNLAAGGAFAYLLCRELGVGRPAALAGALAFQLGAASIRLMTWTPAVSSTYVWLPGAMLFCERILHRPSLQRGVMLGATLSLTLLTLYPQVTFFAYQLIALRVGWDLAARRLSHPAATLRMVAFGLLLAPVLAAVALLPDLELVRLSVRGTTLGARELSPTGALTWSLFRTALEERSAINSPLVLVPVVLGSLALLRPATRHTAAFYLASALLYFTLAFGVTTPLFVLYTKLPLGTLFREPARFMWLVSFCLAVLAALGLEAVTADTGRVGTRPAAGTGLIAALALAALALLTPGGLRPLEWGLGALAVAAATFGASVPPGRRAAATVLVATLAANLIVAPPVGFEHLLRDGRALFAQAPLFDDLRARMSSQDRVYLIHEHVWSSRFGFGFMQKSPELFGVRSIQDNEPQITRRYAELFVMLRTGHPLRTLNDIYYYVANHTHIGSRRLLDVTAARFLLVDAALDNTAAVLDPPPRLLEDRAGIRVYENASALPRAFYVPRVEVVPDATALLQRLATGPEDPREVTLIEAPLPSGFAGTPGNHAPGAVSFVADEPENIVLRVEAPARGFLFLADQHFPGWRATVNGTPTPIVRANYTFRLVEVPGGQSTVEFRFVPASVWLGVALSAITLLAAGGVVVWRLGRDRS